MDGTEASGTSSYSDGLVQDCSNSSVLAMELLQSCTKPLIYLICIGHGIPINEYMDIV